MKLNHWIDWKSKVHRGDFATNRFGVSGEVRFKPACSSIETSWNSEISFVASFDTILSNKGITKTAQMLRLVCAFFVRKTPKTGFFASRFM